MEKVDMLKILNSDVTSSFIVVCTIWTLLSDYVRLYSLPKSVDIPFASIDVVILFVLVLAIILNSIYRNGYFIKFNLNPNNKSKTRRKFEKTSSSSSLKNFTSHLPTISYFFILDFLSILALIIQVIRIHKFRLF